MRVPVDWLGEHVTLAPDVTGEGVAAALVRVGLEEEGLHSGDITGPLVVGRVLSCQPEEQKNGKVINWCTVDVGDSNGTGEPQGIVCGAHNFGVGDLVVVILPGGVLPGGFEISARKTYGHVSAGMICSTLELGIGQDHDGILVLTDRPDAAELTPGQDAIALLGLDRETVEINVTPDRGYCFSIRGVAREYGHATGAPFVDPVPALTERAPAPTADGYPVELRDDRPIRGQAGCGRYVARVVRGVDVSAPTPPWMATRLTEAGMRPISLPVDIANYVMLDLGQPLHTFDLATLEGPVLVRRARAGERLRTLDGTERTLDAEDLLITDGGERVLALAGVMGGQDSEVGESTTDILIEAAHFDPVTVARTARRHKLPSEASRRFERGVDPLLAPAAAQRAVELLVEHGGGVADPGVTDVGEPPLPTPITLPVSMPSRIVGVDYPAEEVRRSLTEIGAAVTGEDPIEVTPPSWRPDLRTGEDLVEEIARLGGYDRIPSVLPTPPGGSGLTHAQRVRRRLADLLADQGLSEVWSAPFVGDAQHEALGLDAGAERERTVAVLNPLSDEQPLLRTRLLTTLIDSARRNVSRGAKDVALFEIGLVLDQRGERAAAPTLDVGAHPDAATLAAIHAGVPDQPRHLAFVLVGERDRAGWWGSGRAAETTDAVEIVRAIGEALALEVQLCADSVEPFHPGRCARVVVVVDGEELAVGHVGELAPAVAAATGLPGRPVAAELDLDALVAASGVPVRARTLSTFPVAHTDVALVVDDSVPAAAVEGALRSGAGADLEALALFDVYRGDQLGEGRKSLAYRLSFRSGERTLTTDEVSAARDAAVAAAATATGAVQR
ncbi:phenylalanine--tRNA ligase subunit beta [Marihabitans asiaticum]|uniref:Phenylalanine--tRNA ligase beta subunit n=1 Tax=Marihabitans asiaticum TaxID=415218 RepID=A0A560WAI6_9MICO|nr:phenylalanine--tRNA ligase subunit beta [Marihabitans asiaticum]TWD14643.1 phenylalanyl-tRNA synthetase beta subunit [Marihabitans asiaticum]